MIPDSSPGNQASINADDIIDVALTMKSSAALTNSTNGSTTLPMATI